MQSSRLRNRLLAQTEPFRAATAYCGVRPTHMTGFKCATCGEYHDELPMCLGAPAPALWYQIPEEERESRTLLGSDSCVIDNQHYFVLGRIVLPVIDCPDPFVWLAWVSLSPENFKRAGEVWETEGRENEPPYFGWLQSALPYAQSTLSLATNVVTRPVGERPLIEMHECNHQLYVQTKQGITIVEVQEIVERAFHGT